MGSSDKKVKGPVFDENEIPYDYIVIIDSGSKGSRAYVYNWLSSKYLVDHGIPVTKSKPSLVKRFESFDIRQSDDDDTDSESEDEEDDKHKSLKHGKPHIDHGKLTIEHNDLLPSIHTRPEWKKKVKPGISSFKSGPGSVGDKHIKKLLKAASKIIPKEQQYRSPIFLHATAGMRLLKPSEQSQILENTCKYIQKNSNFYLPDCSSHVNIIDGDIEGLYGWIGLNFLMGSFNNPEDHHHGKNHHTYGLLDMGGASTQIAFQPNETEVSEHSSTLYKLQLASFGQFKADLSYDVFSTSFLGYGMYQSHDKYLSLLADKKLKESNKKHDKKLMLSDPCLPKGIMKTEKINNINNNNDFKVEGTGNFTACLNSLYPLLISDNSTSSCDSSNPQDTSSCLLSDSIPSLDFDVDNFIGVSGYWDSIGNLLNLKENHDIVASPEEKYSNAYKYNSFYEKTSEICEIKWEQLKKLNSKSEAKDEKFKLMDLSDDELSELCYKSSWVLNILHRGLGFPRYGIDEEEGKASGDKTSIHVAESINGSDFSWTLGRAVLYSSAESAAAFASKSDTEAEKIGFFHGLATDTFYYGGEVSGVDPRPDFISKDTYKKFRPEKAEDSHWERLEKHRFAGSFVFLILLLVIAYLLMGRKRRANVLQSLKRAVDPILGKRLGSYVRLGGAGLSSLERNAREFDIELGEVSSESSGKNSSEEDDQFRIDDD